MKTNEQQKTRQALEMARHELTTLHGLIAADGACPSETFPIDTSEAKAAIDAVLSEFFDTNSQPS